MMLGIRLLKKGYRRLFLIVFMISALLVIGGLLLSYVS